MVNISFLSALAGLLCFIEIFRRKSVALVNVRIIYFYEFYDNTTTVPKQWSTHSTTDISQQQHGNKACYNKCRAPASFYFPFEWCIDEKWRSKREMHNSLWLMKTKISKKPNQPNQLITRFTNGYKVKYKPSSSRLVDCGKNAVAFSN